MDHLTICLDHDVSHTRVRTGFEEYAFVHQALPEMDLSADDTSTSLFGKRIAAPLIVSPMVGGIETAAGIALPLLRPGTLSTGAVIEALQDIIDVLKMTMFCTGTPDIPNLATTPHLERVERG